MAKKAKTRKIQETRIREFWEKSGLSQEELADKAGINQRSVSLYVNGKREPSLGNLYKLAKVLKVDVCDLLLK